MAKWNCSSGCLKWLFTSESKEKPIRLQKPKKPRKWKCCVSKRSKLREHPTHTAPNRTLSEAIEEQRKHALNVAIATAAAAEAAVAAAHAAAEVVRLTAGVSHSFHYLCKEDRILAAVKIQSAYRRHLARKALRSLKGIVTLQALVRGQAVRSQVSNTLKHMPSNAKNQVEMQDRGKRTADEVKESPKLKGKFEENQTKLQFECQSQRTGDCSLHSKEDIEGICFRKKEAILRRECMKQFSFFRQEKKTPNKDLGRETCRTLGQWLDEEAEKSGKKKNSQQHLHSQVLLRRKSFSRHGKEISSVGENNSMPNSPAFPSYMAVTESARAKVRSMSAPRQRTEFLDICSN